MAADNNNIKIKSKVESTVDLLLNDGVLISCDDSTVDSKTLNDLPGWYDEEKFKRGQKFYHDNVFVMLLAKFCGLLTILTVPRILEILIFTNMSETPLKAYRRYMATIFHMTLWYDEDFKPGTKSWESVRTVRNLHFCASNRASNNIFKTISQADMVFTQFGFMGFIITNPKLLGFHNATDEDFEGLIHVWRVIGHQLGIDDRFNLCNGSVEETKEYCNLLMQKVFAPNLKKINNNFKQMTHALVDGMLSFQPFLNYTVLMIYIHRMCNVSVEENNNNVALIKMTKYNKFMLYTFQFVLYSYQFLIIRLYHNFIQRLALYYIIKYFPFLAYIKFGFKQGQLPKSIININ